MVLPFPKSPYFQHNSAQNDTDTLCELCDPKWTCSCSILFFDPHTNVLLYIYQWFSTRGPVPTRGPQHTSKGYARFNNLYKQMYMSFVKLYTIL